MSRTANDTARILNREHRRRSDSFESMLAAMGALLPCGCVHHVDGKHTPWRVRQWAASYSGPEYIRADVIRAVCIVHTVPTGTFDIPTKVTLPSHF